MDNYFSGIEFGDFRRRNVDIESIKRKIKIQKKIERLKAKKEKNPNFIVKDFPIPLSIDDAIKYYESRV